MHYTVLSMGKEGKIKSIAALRAAASHNARMAHGTNEKLIENANPHYDMYNLDITPMFEGKKSRYFDFIDNKVEYPGFNFVQLWYERMGNLDFYSKHNFKNIKKNTNLALEIIVSYSHEAEDYVDTQEWVKANVEWFDKTFNVAPDKKSNILSAIMHNDERTKHIHCIIIPVDENGRLNSQRWIGGPSRFREIRQSYDKMMEPLGLEPGVSRSRAKKDDLPHFYKLLEDSAMDVPEVEPGETANEYKNRTLEYYQQRSANERLKIFNDFNEELRSISIKSGNLSNKMTVLEQKEDELNSKEKDLNELISDSQELINIGYIFRNFEKIRKHYKDNPVMSQSFENVIEVINNWEDYLIDIE